MYDLKILIVRMRPGQMKIGQLKVLIIIIIIIIITFIYYALSSSVMFIHTRINLKREAVYD